MGQPVPVQQMPAPAAPFAVGGKSRSVAKSRVKKKSSPVPLLIGGSLLALAAVGVVAIIATQNSGDGGSLANDNKATAKKTLPLESPKKVLPAPVPEKPPKVVTTEPKPQVNPNQPISVDPKPIEMTPEQKFEMAIITARDALGVRDLEKAKHAIDDAEFAKTSDAGLEQVEGLRTLYGHLDHFWNAVREGIYKRLEPGDAFEHEGEEVELVSREGEIVTMRFGANEHTGKINDLPPAAAALFARKALNSKDAKSLLAMAAFWTLDAKAAARPDALERAKRMWTEAAERGQVDLPLARALGLDDEYVASIKPKAAAPEEGLPKLPPVDKPEEDKPEQPKPDDSKPEDEKSASNE
jgi:hypothetical protein